MKLDLQKRTNEICLGIAVILIYFLASELSPIVSSLLHVEQMPNLLYLIWNILYELIIIGIVILLLNKKIIKDYNDMKINYKKYFKENFKYYLIGLGVMLVSNVMIIFVMKNGLSNNEQGIRDMLSQNPVYTFIASVLLAPLLEELIFRQGFRNIFKNKYLFILFSGIVFGSLHVILSITNITDLLYLIPYCSLGLAFAYILYKTDNIFVTIGLHFMHNGILVALQILVLLFG